MAIPSYTPTEWKSDATTPINANNLNKIEHQLEVVTDGVNDITSEKDIQTATGTSLSLTSVADTCKVKSNSVNIFDESQITNPVVGNSANIILTLKPNTEYTCSTNCPTSTGSSSALIFFASGTVSTGVTTTANGVWDGQTRTFTSDSNGNVIFIYRLLNSDTNVDLTSYWYQIEEGSTATTYNPYNTKVLVRTKNLITNIIEGYALSSNTGAIAANPQRAVTDFIDVEPNMEYVRSGYSTTGTVFYDANKNRISNDNSNPFTTPSGTKYVRLGINSTLDYSQAQLEKGNTATTYVKGESQEISLTPQEEKVAFTYDTETNILSDGSVTIEYNTQSRLLNNDDTTAIKEYVDDIIEEGSNDKGNYIKYRSGIMICTSRTTYTNIVVNTASGSCYSNDANIFIDFPETFISRPVVSLQVTGTTTGWVQTFTATGTPEIRTDGFRIFRTTSRTSSTYYIDMIAIGRWK